ncbi:MAG: hypothetical protein ACE3JK_07850 [Sporolactobacillus sp.]
MGILHEMSIKVRKELKFISAQITYYKEGKVIVTFLDGTEVGCQMYSLKKVTINSIL